MRSEFLGVCARFKGLAEAVNRTQYLLPQMERPALLRAIREPAMLYDGEVSCELAERLIADAGGGQDQLPLIQHGLMLLWRNKIGAPAAGTSEPDGLADAAVPFRHQPGSAWRLDLIDYQGAGSLADLLSKHADQVMEAAARDPERKKIVEHLFRALTDINAEGNAVRRPQKLAELMATAGASEEVVKPIIDHFRAEGVSFLTPYGTTPIESKTLIDISHEALIRCWQKIADKKDGWLQLEFRDGLIWKTLRMLAQRGEILSATATEGRDAWLTTLPSPGWAKRYDGGWEDVQRLMSTSRKAAEEDARRKQDLEEARRREAEARALRAEEARAAAAKLAEARERIAEEQTQRADAERKRAVEAEAHAKEAETGRRRSRKMAIAAGVFGLLALGAALAAGWSWHKATLAQAELQTALQMCKQRWREVADRRGRGTSGARRRAAWHLLYRAVQARDELQHDLPITAMQLALAGLPEHPAQPDARPWVGETAGALVEAMGAQRELKDLRGHEGGVLSVAFSPQGDRIVSGGQDGTVRLWRLDGTPAAAPFKGHEGGVSSVAFSPQGDRIVSGGYDGTVRLWRLDGTPAAAPFKGHEGWVSSVAFSPQGDRIVSGGQDGTVRLWQLDGTPAAAPFKGHEGWSGASRSRRRATGSSRAGRMARCGSGSSTARPRPRPSRAMRVGSERRVLAPGRPDRLGRA